MSARSIRSGSPVSTSSSAGGEYISTNLNGISNLARADADLIPKSVIDLNEDRYSDENKHASTLVKPFIHDRSISYVDGVPPEVYLLQNQTGELNLDSSQYNQLLQRAFTAPMSSRLGHLAQPGLSNFIHTSDDASDSHPKALQNQTSQELANLVQLTVQTIIQLSPPHLLDFAKEQYAACGLTFPTPSVSSFLTVSKVLNYLSVFPSSSKSSRLMSPKFNKSWDIGEMLQGIADSLAGLAAERSINIVIAHAGANLQHVSVKGDRASINEGSLSFGLLHILRRILDTALPGSSLEISLHITPEPDDETETKTSRLTCTFEIQHYHPKASAFSLQQQNIPSPFLANLVTRHILSDLVVDLKSRPVFACTPDEPHRRCYDFVLSLLEGDPLPESLLTPEEEASRQPFGQNFALAREPTIRELETLATKDLYNYEAEFYCHPDNIFAKHICGYLSSWRMQVNVHNIDNGDSANDLSSQSQNTKVPLTTERTSENEEMTPSDVSNDNTSFETGLGVNSENHTIGAEDESGKHTDIPNKARFIIIDDDIITFKKTLNSERLKVIRRYHQSLASQTKVLNPQTNRPSLHSRHTNSSQLDQPSSSQINNGGPYFIHFTSLENYKLVIDAILSARVPLDTSSNESFNFDLPNIQVLPKPAGPRRVLTALHTSINKPVVDPHFRPLATTPLSPSVYTGTSGSRSSFYSSFNASRSSLGRTEEDKTPSDQIGHRSPSISSQQLNDNLSPQFHHKNLANDSQSNVSSISRGSQSVTSPMDTTAINYFSHKAAELGDGNKGMLIQSHDGRAAGVFFDPTQSPVEELHSDEKNENVETKGSNTTQASSNPSRVKRNRRHSNANPAVSRHGSVRRSALYKPNIGLKEMIDRAKSNGLVEDERAEDEDSKNANIVSRASTTALHEVAQESAERPDTLNHSQSDPPPAMYADAAPSITSLPKFTLDESEDIPRPPSSDQHGTPTPTQSVKGIPGPDKKKSNSSQTEVSQKSVSTASASTSTSTVKEGSNASVSTFGGNSLDIPKTDSPDVTQEQKENPFDNLVERSPGERPALNTRQRSKSVLKSIKDAAQAARRDVQSKYNESKTNDYPAKSVSSGWMSGSNVTPPVNVLIVEDNPINQTILKKFMTRRNVKYDIALNGEEAVEKWRTGTFHLILMDLALPIMSGVEAARQIRAMEKNQNIGVFPSTPPSELPRQASEPSDDLPHDASIRSFASSIQTNFKFRSPVIIVALTASSATSDRVAALEAGCNDFLTKPVNFQWLERKIIEWGCMQALIDIDGWKSFRMKRFAESEDKTPKL
ncbi:hypothetical protein E3Q22_01974 [Wallemia mellicola]|uniref:Response regulatory domain-containing protein n=1 Tax=Wallemia mellicola TaxID=1708541 RepID=A0A4T0MB89_9BASI|nr:hypothetical protein E3Q22_01974 [Wallemia mellicola]